MGPGSKPDQVIQVGQEDLEDSIQRLPEQHLPVEPDFRHRQPNLLVTRVVEKVFEKALVFDRIYDDGIGGDAFNDGGLGLVQLDAGKEGFQQELGKKTGLGRDKTAIVVVGPLQGGIAELAQASRLLGCF